MLVRTPKTDITKLDKGRLAEEQQHGEITSVRSELISNISEVYAGEDSKAHVAQIYWFQCPRCKFDWREWLKPSITFISPSYISGTCPNCRTRHVAANRIETDVAVGTFRLGLARARQPPER
jgi:hypothetical protein